MNRNSIFLALADENRRLLLDRLRLNTGQTLVQLCAGQKISRQAVSKHLGVLEAANLVVTERRGREKLHFLNPVPLHAEVSRWLARFDMAQLGALAASQERQRLGSKKAGE